MSISGINAGIPSSVYETNMQHVGGTTQSVNKRDLEPTEATGSQAFDEVTLTGDSVDQAQDAFENAAHTGALGATADDDDTAVGDETEVPAGQGAVGDDAEVPPAEGGVADGEPGEGSSEAGAPAGPAGPDGPDDPEAPNVNGSDPDASEVGGSGEAEAPQKTPEEIQADLKAAQEEREQWEKFWMDMHAQQQKHFAELMKIMQDLQDFMFHCLQDVAKHQAEAGSRWANEWDKVIRGDR